MKVSRILTITLALTSFCLPACSSHKEEHHVESHRVTATCPQSKPVTVTKQYVCQIHSQRHIKVRALEMGYLEAIPIKEGQQVSKHDLLFSVRPVLYKAKADAENMEAEVAKLEYNFTQQLAKQNVVSENEVKLLDAKMKKARARADLAAAELDFAYVKAPFDGIVDRLHHQEGSLVQEGEILTTLSDNSVMWVYFNVPEKVYLEFMANKDRMADLKIELQLANGNKFDHLGKIGAIEADFNNETGNIPFRADFPNRDGLLRNGQTGTILISRIEDHALVIPQRATFEVLQKRYVYVVDEEDVAHQREIEIDREMDDLYVVKSGIGVEDKIVLEGARQVHDGDKVEYEDREPEQVVANLKYHAE